MLQIIPVIDIQDGIVVHARGGDRQHYPPLQSALTRSVEPAQVMSDLLHWQPFSAVYIADLDAIQTGSIHRERVQQLCHQFSDTEIWLDAGIKTAKQLATLDGMANLRLVLGSETLQELSVLNDKHWAGRLMLSLDRKNGRFLGLPALLADSRLWTEKVIMMSLDHVGGDKGPALEWLQQLIAERRDIDWLVAGGVRHQQDLEQIEQTGAAGALIASALHTGQLSREALGRLLR